MRAWGGVLLFSICPLVWPRSHAGRLVKHITYDSHGSLLRYRRSCGFMVPRATVLALARREDEEMVFRSGESILFSGGASLFFHLSVSIAKKRGNSWSERLATRDVIVEFFWDRVFDFFWWCLDAVHFIYIFCFA